jgi:hypothetical protein
VAIVDSLYDRRSSNHTTAKVATIQALDSLASALNGRELDVDLGGVWVGVDMDNVAKLALAFLLDVK